MNKTVYLCGFMGCGKTTVGKLLAGSLGCGYADMDEYIVKTEGMTIPQIFADKGELYFREKETDAVKILGDKGGVIACGGGAMLKDINAELAAQRGVVVYINTPFEVCYSRISGDANRPIVMNNTKEALEELYNKRAPVYISHSGISVDGNGTPMEIADAILGEIK